MKRTKLDNKTAKKEAKKSVAIAKARAYDRLYADMDTTEGQKKVLRMAKEREKNSKDIYQSKVIKDEEERVLVDDLNILEMEGVLSEADERREPKRRKASRSGG